jgi:RND family efflux transporter MFP subunit
LKTTAVIGAGLVVVIVAGGLFSRVRAHQSVKAWTEDQAVPTVSIINPSRVSGDQTLILPGNVQAFYDAQIHARVSGYLKRWYDDIGAQVKAGQILADIDTPELDQQLAQAKASLTIAQANRNLAQTTAQRWSSLVGDDAVSKQESDEKSGDLAAKAALVKGAEAEVRRLEALEGFKRITAPFDGVVTGRTTDIGALVAAGAPNDPGLFRVADVHRLRIYVKAPQAYAADFHPGQTAALTAPEHPGQSFVATLASTNGAVSDQSGTMLVELQIDNASGALRPGDFVQVRFNLAASAGVVRLPASAVMFRRKGMAVATLGPGDHVVMKYITIASDLGTAVEVASGLDPRDRIIDNPPDSLSDGEAVRVAGAATRRANSAQEG